MKTANKIILFSLLLFSYSCNNKEEVEKRAKILADSLFKERINIQESANKKYSKKETSALQYAKARLNEILSDTIENYNLNEPVIKEGTSVGCDGKKFNFMFIYFKHKTNNKWVFSFLEYSKDNYFVRDRETSITVLDPASMYKDALNPEKTDFWNCSFMMGAGDGNMETGAPQKSQLITNEPVENSSALENINGSYKFSYKLINDGNNPSNNRNLNTITKISIQLFQQTGGGNILIKEVGNLAANLEPITFNCVITSKSSKKLDKIKHIIQTTYLCDVEISSYKFDSNYQPVLIGKKNSKNYQITLLYNEKTEEFKVSLTDNEKMQTFLYSNLVN